MTRLTWRQFRAQAVTAAAVLAAFAVLLAATGPHLASLYAASGITGCHGARCSRRVSHEHPANARICRGWCTAPGEC